MKLSRDEMLARGRARDPAADGVFLTCVRTTGIYCLPSCRAKTPKPENVEHAATPAEARARGFRACLRCRPDDHYAGRDGDRDALLRAVAAVRARPADFADVAAFARAAGCGATKLLQSCRRHLHRAPADVLLAARLDHARSALATTRRKVLDVALDAGFASSSAFHENFRARFGMAPRRYRAMLAGDSFALALPDDLPLDACFRYQTRDEQSASERGDDRSLELAFAHDGHAARLELRRRGRALHARVAMTTGTAPGADVMARAHAMATRMLRLDVDPAPGERALAGDAALRPFVRRARGLRPWGTPQPFDCVLFAILGQQVNLAFAQAMRRDLTLAAGARCGDLVAPPTAAAVANLDVADLLRIRCSRSKAETVLTAARAVATGSLDFDVLASGSAEAAAAALQALRGIGPWTAQYVLMRGLGFGDCLPIGDTALATAAQQVWGATERPDGAALERLAAPFRPHRSLLAFHLWRVFADARTKPDACEGPTDAVRPVARGQRGARASVSGP